jgi:hypothetical protein
MTSFVTYDYNDPNEVGTKHNLTQVTDSEGHVVEAHQYDTSDRVTFTQSEGGNHAYTFFYDTPAQSQTTVRNSRSVDTVYAFDGFHGHVTSSAGPGCTSCGSGGETLTLTYDNFLNVRDRIDARGVRTHMTHDGKGNVVSRTEGIVVPANPLVERTTYYCYHPTFNFVTTTKVKSVGACTISDSCSVATTDYSVVINDYDGVGNLMSRQVKGCVV